MDDDLVPPTGGESASKPRKTALDKINALGDSSFDHTTISAVTMKNGWLCKQGAFIKNWKKRCVRVDLVRRCQHYLQHHLTFCCPAGGSCCATKRCRTTPARPTPSQRVSSRWRCVIRCVVPSLHGLCLKNTLLAEMPRCHPMSRGRNGTPSALVVPRCTPAHVLWLGAFQKGRPFCFRLNHAHRTYYFQAGNAQELEDWVCMIALAIASAQPDVVTPPAARATSYSSGLRPDGGPAAHEPAARSMSSRSNARAARAATQQEHLLLTAQVREFYRVNNPEKCNERHIARVVESYQGRADALWEDLRRKYPGVQLPPQLPVAPPVPPSRPTAAVEVAAAPGDEGEDATNSDPYAAP